jgi:ectoine hydroxylase-related dioxygenase (phytanoyl-CoA dioxygenase family)
MQGSPDAAERSAWERDGFFIRESVFAPSELEELRAAAERVVRRARRAAGRGGRGYEVDGNRYHEVSTTTIQFEHAACSETLRVIEPFHHLDGRIGRLVDDARLVEPMRGLVGSREVALFTDKLNLKRPREGSRFRWHQDSPYWAHFCAHLDRLPNAMVALDDATEENGCLRVIAGSHARGCLPGLQGEGVLGPLFTDPRHFDLSRQVPAVMPAGSILFFSPHIVHGSEPNLSDRPRRACVLTYQPAGHRMFRIDAERRAGEPRQREETTCPASMTSG